MKFPSPSKALRRRNVPFVDDLFEIESNHGHLVQVVGVVSSSRGIRERLYYHKQTPEATPKASVLSK